MGLAPARTLYGMRRLYKLSGAAPSCCKKCVQARWNNSVVVVDKNGFEDPLER